MARATIAKLLLVAALQVTTGSPFPGPCDGAPRRANRALAAAQAAAAQDLYQGFLNPPREHSLMPYWFWNGRVTPADTRRQIREMIGQGVYQAIVFPWDGMAPPYLSEEYWAQVGAALDIARELNFTLNFADEHNWPSGHAWDFQSGQPELSRVLLRHPEFRMRRLDYAGHTVEGPRRFRLHLAEAPALVVAGRQDGADRLDEKTLQLLEPRDKKLDWRAPPGRWLVTVYTLVAAVGAHNTRVDLLNPDAVRVYLDLVYEEFARRFPQHLGRTLRLTVADHEGAYGVPIAWTPRLWEEFRERKGYDLRPMLPLLTQEAVDAAASGKLRSDYLDVVSELYVNAFSKQVADWCRSHGLGHGTSLYEEQLWIQVALAGDMFRHWRAGSFVMIDALLERARMPLDFKEAVSVAHLERKPLVVENQGLQGHDSFLSPEKMRLGTNMCLLWGANLLVPYFDYDPKKITWPPQWFLGQPFWPWFHRYANYVRRAQYMNAQGRHVAAVALYYPLETAFAHSAPLFRKERHELYWGNSMDQVQNFYSALQLELAREGWDYHILDSHYLRRAEIRDRALHIADESFRVLILAPMTEMDAQAAAKVRAFAEAGGAVLALGAQPESLTTAAMRHFPAREHKPFMDRLDYMRPIATPPEIRADLAPLLDVLRAVDPPPVEVRGERSGIYFSRRQDTATDWYWAVNDTPQERQVAVRFPGPGPYEKWDAETGERCSLGSGPELTLHFSPWDAFFVVRSGTGIPACQPGGERLVLTLPNTGWRFTLEASEFRVPYTGGQSDPLWLAPERLSNGKWWLIGPFPYDDHQGFFRPWPPEGKFRRGAKYRGAFGDVRWKWYESATYTVTLREALGLRGDQAMGVYYAYVDVYSPAARNGRMLAAFADSLRAWWNGKLVLSEHRHPKWTLLRDAWAESRPIELRRGWNRVLLKIGPSLAVPTAFMFRITDEHGATLGDLVYARQVGQASPPVTAGQARMPVPLPQGPGSWTDSGLAHYSGAAVYETQFEFTGPAGKLLLELGEVGVAAEVWLNGEYAGMRAWRPFRFDITRLVRPQNTLKIRVANSDAGGQSQGDTIYPRGSWGLKFRTERDRLKTLRPNGLEGPVRIVALP